MMALVLVRLWFRATQSAPSGGFLKRRHFGRALNVLISETRGTPLEGGSTDVIYFVELILTVLSLVLLVFYR